MSPSRLTAGGDAAGRQGGFVEMRLFAFEICNMPGLPETPKLFQELKMQRFVALKIFLFALLLSGFSAGKNSTAADPSVQAPAESENPSQNATARESESEDDSKADDAKSEDEDQQNGKDDSAEDSSDEKDDDEKDEDESGTDKKSDQDEEEKSSEKSDKSKQKSEKKPKPHKVKQEALKIEVELDGIFVADEMEELALRPEVWTRFKVLEAVEHGSVVKKGEVLVRFDDEKLEKDLAKEALAQNLGQLDLMQAEEELPRIRRLQELAFDEAERRRDQTKEDYDYYHEIDRPFTVQLAHFRYKSAQEQLASAQEELNQLQQMYEADELTEETEEIVLRRQRFAVETAELILKLNEENRDYTLNVGLPRSDQFYESSLEESELSYQQAKTALEMGQTRRSYDMEKKRKDRADSIERHGKLLSDKGLMELRAPCDGVVYYGKCSSGKWSQIATLKAKLKPFGTVTTNSVLMTIVKPAELHVESTLGEKELPNVQPGQEVTILPTADKEHKLDGKVAHIDSIPGASNKFRVDLTVDLGDAPDWIVAGMTCDAKVVVYENEEAVVMPLALVQTDKEDDDVKYVMVVDEDEDQPVRREVELGRKQGKIVEVLKGLEAGEAIVKEEKNDEKE
ncbi:MAG: efflux RND transporter periplasmic adaptor subunit [Bythopirellula sp.]